MTPEAGHAHFYGNNKVDRVNEKYEADMFSSNVVSDLHALQHNDSGVGLWCSIPIDTSVNNSFLEFISFN